MRYFVLTDAGQEFGPADLALLQQWVDQRRITPATRLREEMSQAPVVASSLPLNFPAPPPPPAPPTASPYGNYVRPDTPYGPKVDYTMHLVWSVLSAVLCCMPLGIAAVIFAGQAMRSSNLGDASKAAEQANIAKNLAIASAVAGPILGCLYFFFAAAIGASGL